MTYSNSLVQLLRKAETPRVPEIVSEIQVYRRWAEPQLRRILIDAPDDSQEKMHASLALLPIDGGQVNYLYRCLHGADPNKMGVLRDSLAPYKESLTDWLWRDLSEARPGNDRILPLASALAGYDPANPSWTDVSDKVARTMVLAPIDEWRGWREALASVRDAPMDPLTNIYRDKGRPDVEHTVATSVLAHYAADKPRLLVSLLLEAEPKSFSILFPVMEANRSDVYPGLLEAVAPAPAAARPNPPRSDRVSADDATRSAEEVEAAQDRQAARAARAAVALVRLGDRGKVRHLLEYGPDSRRRSAFINALAPFGTESAILVDELDRLADAGRTDAEKGRSGQMKNSYLFDSVVSMRRVLIQALAGYPKEALDPRGLDALIKTLTDLYRNDPDAGVHSSAELVLRRWGYGDRLKLPTAWPAGPIERRWYVNPEGQSMVFIDGPLVFDMGTSKSDPDYQEEELQHRQGIPRRFFIASTEVSNEEFKRYAISESITGHKYNTPQSPDPDGPMIRVNWFDGAAYCNWLSKREGLPRCYEPNEKGEYAEGMRVNDEAVSKGGYRLPTEAEWEYACRAGTVTSRYYGHAHDLLGSYEWYVANSGYNAHSGARLLPNEFGLFDMLANVMEWCHDRHSESNLDPRTGMDDDIIGECIFNKDKRYVRCDKFNSIPTVLRSATRGWNDPWDRRSDLGFRVARTCP